MMHGKGIAACLGCLFLMSAFLIVMEIDGNFVSKDSSGRRIIRKEIIKDRPHGDGIFDITPYAQLPNEGRKAALAISNDVGTRSKYNGLHQRERQRWLREEERRLMEVIKEGTPSAGDDRGFACRGGGASGTEIIVPGRDRRPGASRNASSRMSETDTRALAEQAGSLREDGGACEDYLNRVRMGVDLWNGTYVPAIAPDEKYRLLSKWAGSGGVKKKEASRILYVISSFDRGQRLRKAGYSGDKLDYILMMMDEVREACEAGFTPHVHLIAAWDATPEFPLLRERSFCRRTGEAVSFTFQGYPPEVKENLSVKHRIYMKSRLDDFDLFIQAEDDMILTINHILLYFEELEKLTVRNLAPGFIRVEPELAEEGNVPGYGGEWFEWEIILSRIEGVRIRGAGVYLMLRPSKVLPAGGNNQGLWMATQGQLRYMNKNCGYLDYTERSTPKHVEWSSGSLEMFSVSCKIKKVFPADRFEDFLIHHRTNNKNGKKGESIPAVSVTLLRLWVSQILRDAPVLKWLKEAS